MIPPILEHATYDQAREMYNNRKVTDAEIAAWFPLWCEGKSSFRMNGEVPQELCCSKRNPEGYWTVIYWVARAMLKSDTSTTKEGDNA